MMPKKEEKNIRDFEETDYGLGAFEMITPPPRLDDYNPLMIHYENFEAVIIPSLRVGTNRDLVRLDLNMNRDKTGGGAYVNRVVTFANADATPTVKNANVFITTGTTAITDFDDGKTGQVIYIKATGNITITYNASIINLSAATNFNMTVDDTLTLCMFTDQVWHELSRTLN